jgi:CRP/FNR family transcriptional regulator, cyclic AMP receptor protein
MEWVWLQSLPPDDRRRLLDAAARRHFARGEVVFHEGDTGDTLHLITAGRAAVRASTPMGEVATFAVLGPGQFFGEQALVDDRSERLATVSALEALQTLAVRRHIFDELRRRHPSLERVLTHALAGQVRRLHTHLLEALFLPADIRVVRRLVVLAEQYAPAPSEASGHASTESPVTVPLTQDDLASLAGTTRPTVNRVLQDLSGARLVHLGRGRIEVLDLPSLRGRAAWASRRAP